MSISLLSVLALVTGCASLATEEDTLCLECDVDGGVANEGVVPDASTDPSQESDASEGSETIEDPEPEPVRCLDVPGLVWTAPVPWVGGPWQEFAVPSNATVVTRFETTSGVEYAGHISMVAADSSVTVGRRMWISECPAGNPIPNHKCDITGATNTNIRWTQGHWEINHCRLKPDHTYFLNMQDLGCPRDHCDVFRHFYNNQKPY